MKEEAGMLEFRLYVGQNKPPHHLETEATNFYCHSWFCGPGIWTKHQRDYQFLLGLKCPMWLLQSRVLTVRVWLQQHLGPQVWGSLAPAVGWIPWFTSRWSGSLSLFSCGVSNRVARLLMWRCRASRSVGIQAGEPSKDFGSASVLPPSLYLKQVQGQL